VTAAVDEEHTAGGGPGGVADELEEGSTDILDVGAATQSLMLQREIATFVAPRP